VNMAIQKTAWYCTTFFSGKTGDDILPYHNSCVNVLASLPGTVTRPIILEVWDVS
jgi:hypothetical protein